MLNMSVEDTKLKIVNVATKLFGRFGFRKTSMDEIAKIARKAKGSLYYHFASKEDLFKEVVAVEINNLKTQLLIIINNPDFNAQEKIKEYLAKRMEVLHAAANYHETFLCEKENKHTAPCSRFHLTGRRNCSNRNTAFQW